MNVASPELCRELYELSGWTDEGTEETEINQWDAKFEPYMPCYDLGYLLRKLPDECTSKKIGGYHYFYLHHGKNTWIAYYGQIDTTEFMAGADTPEDAACKLAIELIKQGILTPKG